VYVYANDPVDSVEDAPPWHTCAILPQALGLAQEMTVAENVALTDEPTAHLDAGSTPAVLRLLRRCADEGAAVIAATHDDDVHAIADRRVWLADGVLSAA
jgi:putative ABC transport system ATP-binding protein